MKKLGTGTAVLAAMAAMAVAAQAAQASTGVKALSPSPGQVFPVMTSIRFSAAFRGTGTRYMRICPNKRRNRNGQICADSTIEQMTRGPRRGKSRVYYATPKLLTALPNYYQNKPGTYYWQAYRIACNKRNDCVQESAVRSFVIR
jgi:hypothetical protein